MGGAVPVGKYIIHKPAKHPHLGLAAYLEPDRPNIMMGRGGFYSHRRGPHGSDGSIVPTSNFKELMDALTNDGTGILHVMEAMGGVRFASDKDAASTPIINDLSLEQFEK
jgi:hypothetical protein